MGDLIMNNMDNITMENMENKTCCFNTGVDCDNYKCGKCGWNPEVAAERIKNIKAKRQAEIRNNK